MKYQHLTKLSLKNHPEFTERWVQDRIAEHPQILGLGDVVLKDKERLQPRAGRLDLLLQDAEASHRYEVEVQLGKTDESHIIRTIEYWDVERKRYPQYDHTAVIVAEEITARFLNVISLFNGTIPLMAIQMSAVQLGEFQIPVQRPDALDHRLHLVQALELLAQFLHIHKAVTIGKVHRQLLGLGVSANRLCWPGSSLIPCSSSPRIMLSSSSQLSCVGSEFAWRSGQNHNALQ